MEDYTFTGSAQSAEASLADQAAQSAAASTFEVQTWFPQSLLFSQKDRDETPPVATSLDVGPLHADHLYTPSGHLGFPVYHHDRNSSLHSACTYYININRRCTGTADKNQQAEPAARSVWEASWRQDLL